MKIQDIFDKTIITGYYPKQGLMCIALQDAMHNGAITRKEAAYARYVIKRYLGDYITLGKMLHEHNLPFKIEARLAIYKNWAKRPKVNS